jgi:hypothetical protein
MLPPSVIAWSGPLFQPAWPNLRFAVANNSNDTIDREASPADLARVAAVVASDFQFAYFGTAAFAVRLLRLDQKLIEGICCGVSIHPTN